MLLLFASTFVVGGIRRGGVGRDAALGSKGRGGSGPAGPGAGGMGGRSWACCTKKFGLQLLRRCTSAAEELCPLRCAAPAVPPARCVYQKPDAAGHIGVELSRDLVKVAAKAMTDNMTRLGELTGRMGAAWAHELARCMGAWALHGRCRCVSSWHALLSGPPTAVSSPAAWAHEHHEVTSWASSSWAWHAALRGACNA